MPPVIGLGPSVAAILVVLLLLVPSTPGSPTVRHSAPFTGAQPVRVSDWDPFGTGTPCNQTLTGMHPGTFNLSTGRARLGMTVAASCTANSTSTARGWAEYEALLGLSGLPFSVNVTGNYSLTARWNVSYDLSAQLIRVRGVAGFDFAISVTAYLVDSTTGTNLTGPNSTLRVASVYGSCFVRCNGTQSSTQNSSASVSGHLAMPGLAREKLIAGDTYQFYIVIDITLDAFAGSFCVHPGVPSLAPNYCFPGVGGSSTLRASLTSPTGAHTRLVGFTIS